MEELDFFHGCGNGAGTPQFSVEKKQGKARGDSFVIEDLLDLPNEEQEDAGMVASDYGSSEPVPEFSCSDSSTVATVDSCINSVLRVPGSHFSGELICYGVADGDLSSDLGAPYGDLTDLEWLSNFVEESFSSEDIQNLQLISAPKSDSSSVSHADNPPAFFRPEAPVPGKARSKRSRTVQCNWSSNLLLLSSAPESLQLDSRVDVIQSSSGKKTAKEPLPATADVRKCLHCDTYKTPQWRMGPLGPKTLCNACGVRFKSGRLMPEYRPVASPTFILSKHSNSHRKVLELRRQSELQQSKFLVRDDEGAHLRRSPEFAGDDFLFRHDLGDDSRRPS